MKHNKSVEQLYDVDFNDIIHKMTILISTPTCNSYCCIYDVDN